LFVDPSTGSLVFVGIHDSKSHRTFDLAVDF